MKELRVRLIIYFTTLKKQLKLVHYREFMTISKIFKHLTIFFISHKRKNQVSNLLPSTFLELFGEDIKNLCTEMNSFVVSKTEYFWDCKTPIVKYLSTQI